MQNFEVTVVTPAAAASVVADMKLQLERCHFPSTAVKFLATLPPQPHKQFDYIEYNGGISLSRSWHEDLFKLSQVRFFF